MTAKRDEGGGEAPFPTRNFADLSDANITNYLHRLIFRFFYLLTEIPKNEYNNKNQSTGNSPIKVELQNNMDR